MATFEKEILLEGTIVKDGIEYPITQGFLYNCVKQFKRMKDQKRKVNVHSEHNYLPETKRGEVVDLYVKKKSDGKTGLFGKIKFLSHLKPDVVKTLTSCDVSAEIPSELMDGNGNIYSFPVQRVAITADPAITGLTPFLKLSLNVNKSPVTGTQPTEIDNMAQNNQDGLLNEDEFDQNEPIETDDEIDEVDEVDDETDDDNETHTTVTVSKKGNFLDSQLAKVFFDILDIDPDDFDNDEQLMEEFTVRLTKLITDREVILKALDIKPSDPKASELLAERLPQVVDFMAQFDEDGDGEVTQQEVEDTVDKDAEDTDDSPENESLKLSVNALMRENRQLKLDKLVKDGKLNREAYQKAKKRFVLKLSLNDNEAFNELVDLVETNSMGTGHSKTPVQHPKMSVPKSGGSSWTKIGHKLASTYKHK
ncbi:hypothetical protein FACS1894189_7680 [Planctomycetales bacterium]|nr:hypothetical protein FACS1894189_7680 [Planctomycetales bacterium]